MSLHTVPDMNDHLWAFKKPLDMPKVPLPPRWSPHEYIERMVNERPTISAALERFPEHHRVTSLKTGDWLTDKQEMRNNLGVMVFIDGTVEGSRVMVAGQNAKVSIQDRGQMRNDWIHSVSSAKESGFMAQWVSGKVETHNAKVWVHNTAVKVRELKIVPEGETPAAAAQRSSDAQAIETDLAAQRQKLGAHYRSEAEKVKRGQKPATFDDKNAGVHQKASMIARTSHQLLEMAEAVETAVAFETREIYTRSQLPHSQYYHCDLFGEGRKNFWFRY